MALTTSPEEAASHSENLFILSECRGGISFSLDVTNCSHRTADRLCVCVSFSGFSQQLQTKQKCVCV